MAPGPVPSGGNDPEAATAVEPSTPPDLAALNAAFEDAAWKAMETGDPADEREAVRLARIADHHHGLPAAGRARHAAHVQEDAMTGSIDTTGTADEIARTIAELVQTLARPRTDGGLPDPADLTAILGSLDSAASGLAQAFDQLGDFLADLHDRGSLRNNDGSDTTHRIAHAATSLQAASRLAARLQKEVGVAHDAVSPIVRAG